MQIKEIMLTPNKYSRPQIKLDKVTYVKQIVKQLTIFI